MDKDDHAFQQRLLATFTVEASEHLQALSDGLIKLKQAAGSGRQAEIVEAIFRESHSLKGAARAVDKREIETLCQALEGVFAQLKSHSIEFSPTLLDLLDEALGTLGQLLNAVDGDLPRPVRSSLADLGRRLAAAASPGPANSRAALTRPTAAPADAAGEPELAAKLPAKVPAEEGKVAERPAETVRIGVARLDSILFRVEALISAKLAAGERAAELIEAQTAFATLIRERRRVVPEARTLQHLMDRMQPRGNRRGDPMLRRLLEYLAWEEDFAKTFEARLGILARNAEQGQRALTGMADGLLDDVKKALMLPIASMAEVLPRFVRDFARSQGKEVEIGISGGETEIDRRILEEIRDPLLHLVRNSLDHGIELPAARLAAGKPPGGRIDIIASQIEGGRIEIVVADDGAGISRSKVQAAAQKLGLAVPADDDPAALLTLVFQSGLSTSPLVTDISGRGLGLAIVREKVERLGGTVTVSGRAGGGTAFRVVLPLTLATFRGVHVRVGEDEFIFPTTQLERVARVALADIWTVENREMVRFAGQAVALVRLAEILGLTGQAPRTSATKATLVVAGSGEQRIAFLVDEVLGEQDVLLKNLGRQLARVRNVAGATVLGNGRVVPILHLPDLLKSAQRLPALHQPLPVIDGKRKQILVAEDSITSRQLLKGILESAGYAVTTAVDGIDAYSKLHNSPFDLLVSDIDMPRMSGFDLTARVRADQTLAELPVVLVTSLDSRQDRERGADVGANAYLVKSNFEQSNLLATIRRLL